MTDERVLPAWAIKELDRLRHERDQARAAVGLPGGRDDLVFIPVSREMLAELGEWSETVEVKIVTAANGYDMVLRRSEALDRARSLAVRLEGELHEVMGAWPNTPQGFALARDDIQDHGCTIIQGPAG